ncbi:heat shock protein beta-3 [Gastrophryne carolinensis]
MEGLAIRHCIETPVRYQEKFSHRHLEDCTLEHSLYALPGPRSHDYPKKQDQGEQGDNAGAEEPSSLDIQLDVVQFRPEDIIIQIFEGCLIIKAEHKRRMDEHGFISRSFTRTYKLPSGIGLKHLSAVFGHDGILAVHIHQ